MTSPGNATSGKGHDPPALMPADMRLRPSVSGLLVAVAAAMLLTACSASADGEPATPSGSVASTTTIPPTSTSSPAAPSTSSDPPPDGDSEWEVGPLQGMLIERQQYADVLFLTYTDWFQGMGHQGEREDVAADVDVRYPPPPPLVDGEFPAPCASDETLVDVAVQYLGQPIPNASDSPPAWITSQAVARTRSAEEARRLLDEVRTCHEGHALGPVEGLGDEDGWAESLVEMGADEAVTAASDDDAMVRAVTVRVGPVVGYLAVLGSPQVVPDVDVVEVLARELLAGIATGVRPVDAESEAGGADPLEGFRVHVRTGGTILAIGDGRSDEVVFEAPPDRPMHFTRPAVAPDGQTVAFVWYDPEVEPDGTDYRTTLAILQPDGSIVDVVTAEQIETSSGAQWANIGRLAWNSDGSWLAFEWQEPSSWGEVWLVRSDGTDLRLATPPSSSEWTEGDEEPVWGPDPEVLYFQSARTRSGNIFRGALDGSGIEQVSPDLEDGQISNATVSPDGRWMVAVNLRSELLVVDLDTGEHVLHPPVREISNSSYSQPQWSPDGRRVVYSFEGGGTGQGVTQALLVEPASGTVERIPVPEGRGQTLVWSEDGTRLLTTLQERFTGMAGLAVVDVEPGEVTPVRQDLGTVSLLQPTSP